MQLVMDELSQMAEKFEPSSKTDMGDADAETSDFQVLGTLKQLHARDHKVTRDSGSNSVPATKFRSKGRWLSMVTNLMYREEPSTLRLGGLQQRGVREIIGTFQRDE